jgi:hypothetical protein
MDNYYYYHNYGNATMVMCTEHYAQPPKQSNADMRKASAYSRKTNLFIYPLLVSLFIPEHNVLNFIMHRGEDSLCPLPMFTLLFQVLSLISEIPCQMQTKLL